MAIPMGSPAATNTGMEVSMLDPIHDSLRFFEAESAVWRQAQEFERQTKAAREALHSTLASMRTLGDIIRESPVTRMFKEDSRLRQQAAMMFRTLGEARESQRLLDLSLASVGWSLPVRYSSLQNRPVPPQLP
jgi:hypothetical protein